MVSFAAPVGTMPPPPAPAVKRPTMGLKRDSSYLDTDDEAGLSQTTKRLKVAFDDHVDVRIMDDWNDKSFDLVKEEVRTTVQRHLAKGSLQDDTQYHKLLQLLGQDAFSGDAPSSKLLKKYIVAINSHVAQLGECSKLALAILDLAWLGRDEEFMIVYEHFLVVLTSMHTKFITPMMDRLVANFERLPASFGRLPGEDPVTRSTMFDRLHEVLEHITQRIPTASPVLVRVLRHQFPNDLSTVKGALQYQRHLLQLGAAIPEVRSEVMALIMQRLVDIDVQIQEDIEELEDDAEERLLGNARAKAETEDDDDSDDDSVSESELTTTDEEEKLKILRVKVAKMDGTQDLLFEHYQPLISPGIPPSKNAAYRELLSHFTSFIMPTRSRHAQFLLFHFSQTSKAYADDFISHFTRLTTDRNLSAPSRLQACAYLASFTARAAKLSEEQVQRVAAVLAQAMDGYRMLYEPSCRGPDRRSYGMYYAIAQALLYVFCFRWRELVDRSKSDGLPDEDVLAEGRDLHWVAGVKESLSKNINSILNPLKACSPAIVAEFAKISNHLRFLYVFSLLERNKRIRLGQAPSFYTVSGGIDIGKRETAMDRKGGDAHHQLEAYFPFDPYHLPISKRWIEGEFNEWKLPRGMKQEDEEEDEEDEEEEEEEDEVSDEEEEEEYESDEDTLPTEAFHSTPPTVPSSSQSVVMISG